MVALAPVTRLTNSKSTFFQLVAGLSNLLRTVMYKIGVYSLFGPNTKVATKYACELAESLCFLVEGQIITQDPSLDDGVRF